MSCDRQAPAGVEPDPGTPRRERLGPYFRMAQ